MEDEWRVSGGYIRLIRSTSDVQVKVQVKYKRAIPGIIMAAVYSL